LQYLKRLNARSGTGHLAVADFDFGKNVKMKRKMIQRSLSGISTLDATSAELEICFEERKAEKGGADLDD